MKRYKSVCVYIYLYVYFCREFSVSARLEHYIGRLLYTIFASSGNTHPIHQEHNIDALVHSFSLFFYTLSFVHIILDEMCKNTRSDEARIATFKPTEIIADFMIFGSMHEMAFHVYM